MNGVDRINAHDAATALDMYEVDSRGLDRLDRAVLEALIHKFGGGPVGLSTLAAVGRRLRPWRRLPSRTWCVRGLIGRTPRSCGLCPRRGSTSAWKHQFSSSPASTDKTAVARGRYQPPAGFSSALVSFATYLSATLQALLVSIELCRASSGDRNYAERVKTQVNLCKMLVRALKLMLRVGWIRTVSTIPHLLVGSTLAVSVRVRM